MLIDDDADLSSVLATGLQRYGFAVTAFNDPIQALEQFKRDHYCYILLDIRMPGMTGFQVAKRIWAIEHNAKICFFSAFDIYEKEAKVIFKDLKHVHFVKKPVHISELAQIIETQLQGNSQVMHM